MTSIPKQPYVSWKGQQGSYPTWNGLVPVNSRPNTNGIQTNPDDYTSPFGKARPLKVWRKQLQPAANSGSRIVSIDQMLKPGGSVFLSDASSCVTCADSSTNHLPVKTMVFGNFSYLTESNPNNLYETSTYFTDVSENIYNKCITCDPQTNVIKSAVTKLNKNYYTTSKAYLQSRCQLYNQKSSPIPKSGVTYIDANGNPVWPSDSANGSQVYDMTTCEKQCASGAKVTTIYKPNNVNFGVQGAVASSTRLMRLKQNTINKNGASFASAFGSAAANAGAFSSNPTAPYFLKSKVATCNRSTYWRTGNPTMCFFTPVANMTHGNS